MSELSVNIDFMVLNTYDPRTIIVGDMSHWGIAETQPAYISVTPPGSKNSISLTFIKRNMMFLTSLNLGLGCTTITCAEESQQLDNLDDGVWEIFVQSAYENLNKKRFYLKTDSLRRILDKIYIREGIEYSPTSEVVKALAKIEWLLEVAHAEIRDGNNIKAMKAFNIACRLTEKYQNCKN